MKKSFLLIALAAVLVFAFASTALAKNAGSAAAAGDGYVAWSTAVSIASNQAAEAAGPHSNYTISTVKCAVCHSTHGAPDNTWLLTKITNAQATGGGAGYVCAYCHGVGATAGAMIVSINQYSATPSNVNTPHDSICYTSCHAGVHGTNVSSYSLLAAKLLTSKADTMIGAAIADKGVLNNGTGLDANDFKAPVGGFGVSGFPFGTAASTYGTTAMATGYLCGQPGCHTQSAFAVKTRGDRMTVQNRAGIGGNSVTFWGKGSQSDSTLTSTTFPGTLALSGHPVVKAADSSFAFPAGSAKVGVTGVQVAFTDVSGCPSCHDLADASTTLGVAFPHNRYDAAQGQLSDLRLWMTKASNNSLTDKTTVADSNLIDPSTSTVIGLADSYVTVQDGVCLKCHKSAIAGVGVSF